MQRHCALLLFLWLNACIGSQPKALVISSEIAANPELLEQAEELVSADPSKITQIDLEAAAAHLTKHYWLFNQSYGIVYPGARSSRDQLYPDGFSAGADSALYTGFALAAFSYKSYLAAEYFDTRDVLTGVYWLTHAAGPGVICRAVIPKEQADRWNYPDSWQGRINSGFVGEGASLPYNVNLYEQTLPESIYYTRATKDQLTGLLYGLATYLVYDNSHPETVATIGRNLRSYLEKYNWKIRNEKGENDTSADVVDGMLKLQLFAIQRRLHRDMLWFSPNIEYEYQQLFRQSINSIRDSFALSNNYSQYYTHNLRITRAYTVWLLEDDSTRKQQLVDYVLTKVWKHTKKHQNAWFAAIVFHMTSDEEVGKVCLQALKSQSLKPLRGYGSPYAGQLHKPSWLDVLQGNDYRWVLPPHLRKHTNYFTWAKEPWDVGSFDKTGSLEETGLDFLLPFWLYKIANRKPY